MKVFLGGTCNGSPWRENLIAKLKVDYFNPVVDSWGEEDRKIELHERKNADYCLYVITPLMEGVYSIAELVDDSNKRPKKTLLCIIDEDKNEETLKLAKFSNHEIKYLRAVQKLVQANGVKVFNNLDDVADFLNSYV